MYAVLALLMACTGDSPESRPENATRNVVIVAADTLRRDRMSAYGAARPTTPRFDARAPLRLERAFATSNWTLPTTASLLTGALPETAGVTLGANESREVTADLQVATPMAALQAAGFRTALFTGNPGLDRVSGLEDGFETFAELAALPTGNSAELVDAALAWLDEGDAGRPFFLWLQPFDTHFPYLPPAEVAGAFRDASTLPFEPSEAGEQAAIDAYAAADATTREALRLGLLDLYDEELLYLDLQVDRLLTALESRGVLDDTLVVWTADHGELFDDGGTTFFFHGVSLRPGVNRIPVLVLHPERPPWDADALFSATDLMPTALDALGIDAGPFPDGVAFGTGARTQAYAFDPVGAGWGDEVPAGAALTDGTLKVLVACESGDAVAYDLGADPEELAGFEPALDPAAEALRLALNAQVNALHPEGCVP